MRYFFSAPEMEALRRAVRYAISSHPSVYENHPVNAYGLRLYKKLASKLEGTESVTPVPTPEKSSETRRTRDRS
jgi:hypothetical protein